MDDKAAILAVEERRISALVAVDMAALDEIFADDLVHVHSNAVVHDKAALLAYIESRRAFVAIERGDLKVRLYGDVALLTGRMKSHLRTADGPIILDGMVTQALQKLNGKWRYMSFQITLG